MGEKILKARQRQIYMTSQEWTELNPVLLPGELGFESDTGSFKIGNGTSHWKDIRYIVSCYSDQEIAEMEKICTWINDTYLPTMLQLKLDKEKYISNWVAAKNEYPKLYYEDEYVEKVKTIIDYEKQAVERIGDFDIYLPLVSCWSRESIEWEKLNPVLPNNMIGIELAGRTGYFIKVGNGSTAWNDLPYTYKPDEAQEGE